MKEILWHLLNIVPPVSHLVYGFAFVQLSSVIILLKFNQLLDLTALSASVMFWIVVQSHFGRLEQNLKPEDTGNVF